VILQHTIHPRNVEAKRRCNLYQACKLRRDA
jgi:hypothetical protein